MNQDKVFSALSDPNRRKMIELLHQQDFTLLELAESFSFISFQAVSKHLKKLEEANLVHKKKQGRYRILSLNRDALKPTLNWIAFHADFWNASFDKLEAQINKTSDHGNSG